MKFSISIRPRRRSTLRDLYLFGIVRVFRRPSILQVWEPLRENPSRSDT